MIRITAALTLAFTFCGSASAQSPTSAEVDRFHRQAMNSLSEVSSVLLASEGEGTPPEERLLTSEDQERIFNIRAEATGLNLEKFGGEDERLQEIIEFANVIMEQNRELSEELDAATAEGDTLTEGPSEEQKRAYLLQAFHSYQMSIYCSENFHSFSNEVVNAYKADIDNDIRKYQITADLTDESWTVAHHNLQVLMRQISFRTCEQLKMSFADLYPELVGGISSRNPFK